MPTEQVRPGPGGNAVGARPDAENRASGGTPPPPRPVRARAPDGSARLALGLSLALHAALLAALALQPLKAPQEPARPQTVEVTLLEPEPEPAPPAPVPAAPPAPPESPPPPLEKPPVTVEKPTPKPAPVRPAPPKREVARPEPVPKEAPVPEESLAAAPPVAQPPAAETAPAPAEEAPRPAAPLAAAPPPPAEPDPALLARYGDTLSGLFARSQTYPRLAAMRGWEGEVLLRLTIARKGGLVSVEVLRSSGYDVLDRHALALVEESAPLPPPPASAAGQLEVTVPVRYRLRAG